MANDREIKIIISADGTAAIAGMRQVGDATEKLGSSSAFEKLKNNWLGITAGITGAYLAFQKIWGLMDAAAEHAERMETLDALTRRFGTTAQNLTGIISENSHGLIGMAAGAKVASDALAKGFSPEQVAQMANIAATMHKTSSEGMSAAEAFKSLEGSITAARERGIVKMMGATIDLASSMGKQYENMSKAEKATAMLNAVSEQASKVQRVLGDDFNSNADKIQRFRNQIDELKLTVGDFALRLSAALFGAVQSIAGSVSIIIGGILKVFELSSMLTDKVGLTKGVAQGWREAAEAARLSGEDLKRKAQENYDLAISGRRAGSGSMESLSGGPEGNVKRAEQLAEIMKKLASERDLADASEKDKSLIRLDQWFDENVKKLHDLSASDAEYSELVRTYAAKRHADISAWATKTSEFYIAERRRMDEEAEKSAQATIEAETKAQELAVQTRLAGETAMMTAMDRDKSTMIKHQAAGEREILAIRQEGLINSITENTTLEKTIEIMREYWGLQRQIEASKRVEVGELDARRLVLEREILDLKKQQRDMIAGMQVGYAQDAFNKIGGAEGANFVGTFGGIAGEVDPYRKDYDRWSAIQDEKITRLLELGATEASLKDEYRQYDLMQEQMVQQQKLAMASSTFGMLAGMANSLYMMQGQQGGKAFEMMKAFRIGETIMNTYSAAVGAYNAMASIPIVGPALGAAAAAAAIAFGMAQVSAISSMKPGGGAVAASMSGLNGGGAGSSAQSTAPAASAPPAGPIINVHIYGNVVDHDTFAREIIPSITKAVAAGVH